MSLGLSTSWNAFRYSEGKSVISEIKGLNFEEIELSFNLLPSMVSDIEGLVRNKQIKVCSVHNFCPIPENLSRQDALPDYYSLASLDQSQRAQAIKYTKRSIDSAVRLEAKAVVLHAGRVEVADRTRDLINLYERGQKDTVEFGKLINAVIKERDKHVGPFFENALRSLEELQAYAGKSNICLGIENRYYLREIPSFEEIGLILEKFKNSNIFYWHDTGHAQLMQNLGLNQHEEFLKKYGARLLGMHIHDISGCRDHQAPLKGDFDFNLIKPYLKNDTIKIMEVHHPATALDLIKGKEFLERLLYGRS